MKVLKTLGIGFAIITPRRSKVGFIDTRFQPTVLSFHKQLRGNSTGFKVWSLKSVAWGILPAFHPLSKNSVSQPT